MCGGGGGTTEGIPYTAPQNCSNIAPCCPIAPLKYQISHCLNFQALSKLEPPALIEAGRGVVEEQDRIINGEVAKSFTIRVGATATATTATDTAGTLMLAVLTDRGDLRSVMGHRLADKSVASGEGQ